MNSTAATTFVMLVSLLLLTLLPSFVYVALGVSSTTPGFLISIVLILALLLIVANSVKISHKVIIFILCLFLTICIYIFPAFDTGLGKPLYSFIPVVLVITTSFLFGAYLSSNIYNSIIPAIKAVSLFLILLGLLSLFFRFPILNYELKPKSVFPFAEPSHYAIFAMPILLATAFLIKGKVSVFILLICFLFGIIYPSVIILVYVWFYLALVLPLHKLLLATMFVLTLFVYMLGAEQASYFTDRVLFSPESENLTALVYMQGWQEMLNSLIQTGGLGTGFQTNGRLDPGSISLKIKKIAGIYKNREDGGFLASKIISEFGVLGIFFVVMYIKYFFYSFKMLKKNMRGSFVRKNEMFFYLLIYFFIVELFFRGVGYFTTGLFFFWTSIFFLHSNKILKHTI